MSGDYIKTVMIDGVEIQENGIIRDKRGWIIGRADDEWMCYQWRMLESGICPCCGRDANAHADELRGEGEGDA